MNHSIYFISADEVERFKIGRTAASSAAGRVAALQVGSPCDLTLVHSWRANASFEEACHLAAQHLGFQHVRGEWFEGALTKETCEVITQEAMRFEELVAEAIHKHESTQQREIAAEIMPKQLKLPQRNAYPTSDYYHARRVAKARRAAVPGAALVSN